MYTHLILPIPQLRSIGTSTFFQLFCNYKTHFRTPFVRKFSFVHAISTCKTIYFFLKVQIYLEMSYWRRNRNEHFQEALEYLFHHLLIDQLLQAFTLWHTPLHVQDNRTWQAHVTLGVYLRFYILSHSIVFLAK